ncbi:hypothetical protein CFP65_0984 [Kitasatospora sp. MMS16-BH015]|uniref:DUF6426 family protein n=1 Tax=Kitasatospora sp. MMS16-BH015 TaxID=2018025 RepID=UPI000CA1EF47|nr:DUF6426 family protein [Kitasatospora sp. MMS16-BH015]AUG75902.1 hypothetical protein CFP65_0984 [Kitasatospora sp. MMS16-BH015]
MVLKKLLAATALGAALFTAVPALAAPQLASATTPCLDDGSDDSCIPPDPGGSGGGTGGTGGSTGTGSLDVSDGNVGDPVPDMPRVVITGVRVPEPFAPASPNIPSYWNGAAPGAGTYSAGKTWDIPQNCYINHSTAVAKMTETITYAVTYQVSTNISATAAEVLTATLGTQLNSSITKTYTMEITLNPGQSWRLNVQYQTVVYAITTKNAFGQLNTEYVNVTKPTGVLTGSACS